MKSVKVLGDKLKKVAWTFVVCGFPGVFEKLNSIFKELLSYATIGGYAGPLVAAMRRKSKQILVILCKRVSMVI